MNPIYTEHVVRAVDELRERRVELACELERIFAAWHRESTCERTRAALDRKRRGGQRVGSAPIGTRIGADGHTLEPDPTESIAVELILSLRRDGKSVRAIADQLNRESVPCRGRIWHRQTVWRVLHRHAGAEIGGAS
jgi:DNA invertase Pin-like site-specific DNA recombinase